MFTPDDLLQYILGEFDTVEDIRFYEDIEAFLAENFEIIFPGSLSEELDPEDIISYGLVGDALADLSPEEREDVLDIAIDEYYAKVAPSDDHGAEEFY
jgi:hypothetical protein